MGQSFVYHNQYNLIVYIPNMYGCLRDRVQLSVYVQGYIWLDEFYNGYSLYKDGVERVFCWEL